MNPDLEHLVILQAQDVELQRLRQEQAEAPRRVAATEAAFKSAEQTLAKVRQDLAREEKLRRSQESDADGHRSKRARLRKQMETATSGAQITALEHEINFGESAIRKLEDEELASLERTESLEAAEKTAAASVEKTRAALDEERVRAADTVDRARTGTEAIEAERKNLRSQIGEGPLAIYDRVAKSRGSGLSEAIDHKCSACQMMVRPQRWNDLTGREHEDQIFTCETCGRMLFWDPRRDTPRSWDAGERLASARIPRRRGAPFMSAPQHNGAGRLESMQARRIICVDMDEVIADALGEHLMRYNRDFAERITRADLKGQWLWDFVPPERQQALADYMMSEDFFAVLRVMPHAQRVLERLQEHYEIYIATAAMEVPSSFNAKFHWLKQHFPYIPPSHIVFCGNKSILRGDFLIDDNPRQLRLFRGEGILFSSPANVNVTGFRRVHDWLEIEKLFLAVNAV